MDTLVLMPRAVDSKTTGDSVIKRRRAPAAPPADAQPDAATGPSLEMEATEVLGELALALRRLVEALPGPVERPAHLQKLLNVKYNTAWRTLAVIRADPPIAAGVDVPLPRQMQQLLDGAARQEVKSSVVERVRKAYAAFEKLVHRHAGKAEKSGSAAGKRVGGRSSFEALLAGLNGETAARQDVVHRRATFKGNSYLWGVQAKTTYFCTVYQESVTPQGIDALSIKGFVGLSALRNGDPLRLTLRSAVYDTATPTITPRILTEYSSPRLPQMAVSESDNAREITLRFEGVGRAHAVDLCTTMSNRTLGHYGLERSFSAMKLIETPTETLLLDMLVPRGWTDPQTLRTSTHGNPAIFESLPGRVPEFELPIREKSEYLGTDLQNAETSCVPRYTEMLRSLLAELGWANTQYDVYRVRVQFPVMQTLVCLAVNALKQ